MEKHLYALPNRCTGCSRCTYACSAGKEGLFIPARSRIKVSNFALEGYSVPHVCFQCPKAACAEACPEEAIFRNDRGVVVVDAAKCSGCGECVAACPYGMIEQYASGKAYKCDLCGGDPLCVAECHFGAIVFKSADKIAQKQRGQQMKRRIQHDDPREKRLAMALKTRDAAVRIPRTAGYGE